MSLRAPRRLVLLALVAPALATVPLASPAAAVRPDPAPAHAVDEWTDGDHVRLPDLPYSRVEVTYGATFGITLDGQVRSAVASWRGTALVAPAFDRPIVDVTADTAFGLALDDQGHVHGWGATPAISADDLAETYRDVAAVDGGAIGVTTSGGLRYWGNAASRYAFDPAVLAGTEVASVDVESWGAVALTTDGRVLSAGGALNGEWFDTVPFPADRADETVVAVDAGVNFAVALTEQGDVVVWGSNSNGERAVPAFPDGRHAVAVSAGMWLAAAVLDDGSVVTWGQRERTELPALRDNLPVADLDLDRYRTAVTYRALASTSAPTISGTVKVGEPLTATAGGWTATPDAVHYQWHAGERAVGTDSPTYTPTADDVGGSGSSESTGEVAPATFTTPPDVSVSGTPRVGAVLEAVVTGTVPEADHYDITWWRAGPDESEPLVSQVPDTEGAKYKVTAADLGSHLVARVVASRAGHEDAVSSDRTATAVVPGTLVAPTVTVSGTPRVGRILRSSVVDDPESESDYQWLRGTKEIPGATSPSYRVLGADLGAQLSLRVRSQADGYEGGETTSARTSVVRPGAARLRVRAAQRAVNGTRLTVRVTGLVAGEQFVVRLGGSSATGRATGAGTGSTKVTVRGSTGLTKLRVVGSFADRSGTTTVRVVRRGR